MREGVAVPQGQAEEAGREQEGEDRRTVCEGRRAPGETFGRVSVIQGKKDAEDRNKNKG